MTYLHWNTGTYILLYSYPYSHSRVQNVLFLIQCILEIIPFFPDVRTGTAPSSDSIYPEYVKFNIIHFVQVNVQ